MHTQARMLCTELVLSMDSVDSDLLYVMAALLYDEWKLTVVW